MKPHLKVLWIAAAWPLIYISTASGSPLTTDYRQSSFTIGNVTYTTPGIYDPTDQYIIGAQETHWFANLQPPNPAYLISPNSGVTEYFSAAFPTTAGWSYAFSDSALSENSLVVHNYSVVGTAQLVGARFHVEYTPHGADPTDNIHWIQVISNNHGRSGHDAPAHEIDNTYSSSPYYDYGGTANSRHFYDFPFRTDANRRHYWSAELFLVTGQAVDSGPGLITFYGGINWGWENHPVPEPSALLLSGVALSALVVVQRRKDI